MTGKLKVTFVFGQILIVPARSAPFYLPMATF
jgi:hypothetical protein